MNRKIKRDLEVLSRRVAGMARSPGRVLDLGKNVVELADRLIAASAVRHQHKVVGLALNRMPVVPERVRRKHRVKVCGGSGAARAAMEQNEQPIRAELALDRGASIAAAHRNAGVEHTRGTVARVVRRHRAREARNLEAEIAVASL